MNLNAAWLTTGVLVSLWRAEKLEPHSNKLLLLVLPAEHKSKCDTCTCLIPPPLFSYWSFSSSLSSFFVVKRKRPSVKRKSIVVAVWMCICRIWYLIRIAVMFMLALQHDIIFCRLLRGWMISHKNEAISYRT